LLWCSCCGTLEVLLTALLGVEFFVWDKVARVQGCDFVLG
jgi:hypothetical protein